MENVKHLAADYADFADEVEKNGLKCASIRGICVIRGLFAPVVQARRRGIRYPQFKMIHSQAIIYDLTTIDARGIYRR